MLSRGIFWVATCALVVGLSACTEEKKPRRSSPNREIESAEAPKVSPADEERRALQTHLRAEAQRSARPRQSEFGMVGLLNAGAGGDPDAPTAPWGRDPALGSSADPLMAEGGIGLGGIGLGSHPRSKPPSVRMGATSVSGRLPPEVIQRIVRQNFGRFRLCYENGLRSNPSLAGRVTVSFVIGTDGSVGSVSGSGDLPDSAVVGCVTKQFYGLTFPSPDGGVVKVTYPIAFAPGDSGPTATINGKTPAVITFDDMKTALEKQGCSSVTLVPDPSGARKPVILTAQLDGKLVSITFATTKDAIPLSEIVRLESGTALYRNGDFVLSILIDGDTDNTKAKALLQKLIKT